MLTNPRALLLLTIVYNLVNAPSDCILKAYPLGCGAPRVLSTRPSLHGHRACIRLAHPLSPCLLAPSSEAPTSEGLACGNFVDAAALRTPSPLSVLVDPLTEQGGPPR